MFISAGHAYIRVTGGFVAHRNRANLQSVERCFLQQWDCPSRANALVTPAPRTLGD
jgi:hypothetical protein